MFAKILLLSCLAGLIAGEEITNKLELGDGATVTSFQEAHKKDIMHLMKEHFDLSLKYLYTSVGYGSQLVQRPGMSDELKEQSDSHWEDGKDVLKKFLQRGGDPKDLHNYFHFQGKNRIVMTKEATAEMSRTYMKTLQELLNDSKTTTVSLNTLNRMAQRKYFDGDWTHYFEEKLEKEAGRTREMAGHVANLGKMLNSGIGIQFFDERI